MELSYAVTRVPFSECFFTQYSIMSNALPVHGRYMAQPPLGKPLYDHRFSRQPGPAIAKYTMLQAASRPPARHTAFPLQRFQTTRQAGAGTPAIDFAPLPTRATSKGRKLFPGYEPLFLSRAGASGKPIASRRTCHVQKHSEIIRARPIRRRVTPGIVDRRHPHRSLLLRISIRSRL